MGGLVDKDLFFQLNKPFFIVAGARKNSCGAGPVTSLGVLLVHLADKITLVRYTRHSVNKGQMRSHEDTVWEEVSPPEGHWLLVGLGWY